MKKNAIPYAVGDSPEAAEMSDRVKAEAIRKAIRAAQAGYLFGRRGTELLTAAVNSVDPSADDVPATPAELTVKVRAPKGQAPGQAPASSAPSDNLFSQMSKGSSINPIRLAVALQVMAKRADVASDLVKNYLSSSNKSLELPSALKFLRGDSASSVEAIPWGIPAQVLAATGGLYSGHQSARDEMQKARKAKLQLELQKAKQEFEQALAPPKSAMLNETVGTAAGLVATLAALNAAGSGYMTYRNLEDTRGRKLLQDTLRRRAVLRQLEGPTPVRAEVEAGPTHESAPTIDLDKPSRKIKPKRQESLATVDPDTLAAVNAEINH